MVVEVRAIMACVDSFAHAGQVRKEIMPTVEVTTSVASTLCIRWQPMGMSAGMSAH